MDTCYKVVGSIFVSLSYPFCVWHIAHSARVLGRCLQHRCKRVRPKAARSEEGNDADDSQHTTEEASESIDALVRERFANSRLEYAHSVIGCAVLVCGGLLLLHVINAHSLGVWGSDFIWQSPLQDPIPYNLFLTAVTLFFSAYPSQISARRVDAVHVLLFARMLAPVVEMSDPFDLVFRGRNLLAARIGFSLVLGNARLTLVLNAVASMTCIYVYWSLNQTPAVSDHLSSHFGANHLVHFVKDEIVATAAIWAASSSLENRLRGEATAVVLEKQSSLAMQIVDSLLGALCDAVVYLNSRLEIVGDVRMLEAMLLRQGGRGLVGSDFTSLLVEEDRPQFSNHFQTSAGLTAVVTAFHVRLRSSMGTRVAVRLYSAGFQRLDGQCGYVVGICEASREEACRDMFPQPCQQVTAAPVAPMSCLSEAEAGSQASKSTCSQAETVPEFAGVSVDDLIVYLCPFSFEVISNTVAVATLLGPSLERTVFTDLVVDAKPFRAIVQEQVNSFIMTPCPYAVTVDALRIRPCGTRAKEHFEFVVRCTLEIQNPAGGNDGLFIKASLANVRQRLRSKEKRSSLARCKKRSTSPRTTHGQARNSVLSASSVNQPCTMLSL
eukprot:TRINITY_DN46277_c0_g1_i1.p1 TRINITY_DN46277_c0_g1~~TRINITY_DN46277_c0_g1_i1.p1  ORF type:complete len:609 (+),score=51.33 TRINITY_DN46277_c0_g1_i1:25-1851(+)